MMVGRSFSALGSSSSKAIYTMIPATEARQMALTIGDQKGRRKAMPTSAPAGSGETRYERVAQCLAAVDCGMIDRDGDSNPLRDVVDGDRHHDRQRHFKTVKT